MKKMASMQVYMASDPGSRQALDRQMITWDENLEKLHVEQYQLRCYLAALQGADLPSTKVRPARRSSCVSRSHSGPRCGCHIVIFGHRLAPSCLADDCVPVIRCQQTTLDDTRTLILRETRRKRRHLLIFLQPKVGFVQ